MGSLKQFVSGKVRRLAGHAKRDALFKYRRITWRNRSLPDFLVIGAQRSGTTSLSHYLRQHPQLLPASMKEVHFFDGGPDPEVDNFGKGQAWYRAHWPIKQETNGPQRTFEVSPLYIFNPIVPERICGLMPDVKLIALLRNPTQRAVSQWFHERRNKCESLPILEALLSEEQRLDPIMKAHDYKNDAFIHHSYKSRGLYYEQIKRYLDYFPLKNILIIISEKFFSEPTDTLRSIFDFLEVDTRIKIKDLRPRNASTNKSEISPDVYQYLNNYFRMPNQALYELVGKNYGW